MRTIHVRIATAAWSVRGPQSAAALDARSSGTLVSAPSALIQDSASLLPRPGRRTRRAWIPGAQGLGPAFAGEPEFPGTLSFGPGFQTGPGFPVLPPPRRSGIRVRGLVGLILAVVLALIALVAFISIAVRAPSVNRSGPCIEGPEFGSVGQPVGNGNFRFDCSGGDSPR